MTNGSEPLVNGGLNSSYGSTARSKLTDIVENPDEEQALPCAIKQDKTTSLGHEIKVISLTSAPLAVTFFLQYSLAVVSIFTISKIGKKELAAVSLATMTFNITSSIFTGMATCLETLCSQAYGAKNYKLVGLYFQRCFVLIAAFNIPLVWMWWKSGYLLKFVVPDPELADLAQSYLRVMSFSTPAYIFFETAKRFLQAQNIFSAGQFVLFLVAPINILLNYLLVWSEVIGIGFLGAPLATTISYWLSALLLLLYIIVVDGNQCWYGFDLEGCFQDWNSILPLALNGTAMLLSEFIAFEILTLSSSRFGTSTLAAQSIASTLATLCFQIPFSASVAGATRIANLLGAGMQIDAIISTKAAYLISIVLSFSNFSLLFFPRAFMAQLFTDDAKVTRIAAMIIGILSVNQLWDCPNIIGAGILRAQGRQAVGSRLNLVAYYVIAVPVALYLGFERNMKVKGLWIGLGLGVFCLAASELAMVIISDWNAITKEAEKRSR